MLRAIVADESTECPFIAEAVNSARVCATGVASGSNPTTGVAAGYLTQPG